MKLSVVIPVYNEVRTVREAVEKVESADIGIDKEIILVDDGSTDGSREVLQKLESEAGSRKLVLHEKNTGKGAAVRSGFKVADGDLIVIHDADLEYDPKEFAALLGPIQSGHADVVFGSRFLGGGPHRVVYFWHYVANRFITVFSNMMTGLNLTDIEVCHKMFKREILESIELQLLNKSFLSFRACRGISRITSGLRSLDFARDDTQCSSQGLIEKLH